MGSVPVNRGEPSFLQVLAAGTDRFDQVRDLGISTLTFKVTHAESSELFVAENLLHAKGGPARHIHHTQDEWFFVRKGEFIIEIGAERHVLKPGDSIWGPRGIAHAWAFTGEGDGCMLFVFNPPAKIEAFFEAIAGLKSYAPSTPEFWAEYEMELVGPPLKV